MTNDHLVSLGGITVEYARLEHFISEFIWALIASDRRIGETITARLGFRARATLLRALFHMLSLSGIPADVDSLDVIVTQAETAVQSGTT